jgi:hypothetical protein
VGQEGKYVVELEKTVDVTKVVANARVALRSDSYALHKVLPSKVDPLVSLMKVEKVPDASYDMVGGLDKQIQEIKEVIELPIKHPELFDALGVAQPKVRDPCLCHAPGRAHVRPAGHGQDALGACRGAPHGLHLHSRFRRGAGAKVHWRGCAHGARALCDGAVSG